MPPTRMRDALVNALLGIVGAIVLLFVTGAWATKESTSSHAADVAALTRAIRDLSAGQQRILDALCDPKPEKPRACITSTPLTELVKP